MKTKTNIFLTVAKVLITLFVFFTIVLIIKDLLINGTNL